MKIFNINFRKGHLLGLLLSLFFIIEYVTNFKTLTLEQGKSFTFILGTFILIITSIWVWLAYQYHQRSKK